jgi:hypothetical protein
MLENINYNVITFLWQKKKGGNEIGSLISN